MKWAAVCVIWLAVAAIELMKMWRHEAEAPAITLCIVGVIGTVVVGAVDRWCDRS